MYFPDNTSIKKKKWVLSTNLGSGSDNMQKKKKETQNKPKKETNQPREYQRSQDNT